MSFTAYSSPKTVIEIAVTQRLADYYQSTLEKKQKPIIEFTFQDLKNTSKGFTSLVILKQALHKSGLDTDIKFIISPSYKRSQLLVQNGDALFTLATLNDGKATPSGTFKSAVLIKSQDMARGVFGLKSNHELMKVRSIEELKKFTAVTNSAWLGDIYALQALGPAKLDLVYSLKSIFMRIAFRNTDFTLIDLVKGTPDFQRQHEDIILVPVPGLLINTNNSRHFLISKTHPNSKTVSQALDKGLKIMQEQGLIKKYYQQVKLYPLDLPGWKIINFEDTNFIKP